MLNLNINLSPHFSLRELTASVTAAQRGFDNAPDPSIVENLKHLCATLEDVRSLLGDKPLVITSGYRCLLLNRALGSLDTSDHLKGLAADFVCPQYGTVPQICKWIAQSSLQFGQLIQESNRQGDTWVHISFGSRREVLTIDANGTRFGLG